jgi:hypothetical protein
MVTKSGERCSRQAIPAGMGFCWQHVPVAKEKEADRLNRNDSIEAAAVVVTAADVIIKIVELAIKYLPEFFGPSDDQTKAKQQIMKDFSPMSPNLPNTYVPGARVDWQKLLAIYQTAKRRSRQW